MDDRIEWNKKTVVAFYDLMFNQCRQVEAVEKYAGDVYIQHNPHVAGGKEAFISYFIRMAREFPGKHVHSKEGVRRGRLRYNGSPRRGSGCGTCAMRLGSHAAVVRPAHLRVR